MSLAPRFDLRLLRAAVTVRDAGSVTAAARRLGTSQPALSRLLAQLEAEIGFELFSRERRRLVPARRSALFLDRAAAMVTEAERMRQLALALRNGQRSTIRILAVPNLALGLLQDAMTAFATHHPEMEVQVALRFRTDLLRELAAGEADFGLSVLPVDMAGLRVRAFSRTEAVCLLPRGHPLTRRRVITPELLDGLDLAVLPEGAVLKQWLDEAFVAAGASYRRRFAVDSTLMAAGYVEAGLCCAVMHPLSASRLPAGVVVRPFRPAIRLTYSLLERADAGLGAIADSLEGVLRQTMAAIDPSAVVSPSPAGSSPFTTATSSPAPAAPRRGASSRR